MPTRGDKVKHVATVNDGNVGRRKATSKRGPGKQIARPREEWIAVPVPAMIDHATFHGAQARLDANKRDRIGRPVKYDYLLNKRLRCLKCGYSMRPQTRREKHRYYHCNGVRQPTPVCDVTHSFHVDAIDDAVWQWVKDMLQNPEKVILGMRGMRREAERQHSTLIDRLVLIVKRLDEDEAKLARLLNLNLDGELDRMHCSSGRSSWRSRSRISRSSR